MIISAALLVLVGLGLFVGGILTGLEVLYWACVAVCVVAAVLLFLARRRVPSAPGAAGSRPPGAAARSEGTGEQPPAQAPLSAAGAATRGTTPPPPRRPPAVPVDEEPPVEEEEVTDLLLVVDLTDEVLVVDEHPRYHLPGCRFLEGRTGIPLPLDEARTDGFTPCGWCSPHRELAARERARKAGGSS